MLHLLKYVLYLATFLSIVMKNTAAILGEQMF